MSHLKLIIALLFISVAAFGQGGYIKPPFIAWPPADYETNNYVLGLNPLTGRGYWSPTSIGNDSVEFSADTVCYFLMGDEYCVELDSFYFDVDSTEICFIDVGDTTCLTWNQSTVNIFNSNGQQDDPLRIYDMTSSQSFWMRRNFGDNSYVYHLRTYPQSANFLFNEMEMKSVSVNARVLTLRNTNVSGNILLGWDGDAIGQDWVAGVERSSNSLFLGEGLTPGDKAIQIYGLGDSIVTKKTIQVDAGMLDEDGYGGAVNMVPVCQGSEGQWEWQYPAGGAIPINDLLAADGTNNINNAAYKQRWRWDSLAGDTAFIFSANTTAAASNLQNLLYAELSGPNATASQSTYTSFFKNTHTGTSSTNYAGWFEASGGTLNYGLGIRGKVFWDQTSSLKNIFINCGTATPTGENNIGITTTLTANGAFDALTSGFNNVALGSDAIFGGLTQGSNNIAIGQSAAPSITTGLANIMIGTAAGQGVSTGDSNTIIGHYTNFNSTGAFDNNTIIGSGAGNNAFGTGNVWIGHNVSLGQNANHTLKIDNTSTASPLVYGDFTNNYVKINGQLMTVQGADVASLAGNITLGTDGNVFEITGTNAITRISTNGALLINGVEVTLIFSDAASLVDGTANSGLNIGFELAGNVNFDATADDTLTLILCEIGSVQRWREKCRSVN